MDKMTFDMFAYGQCASLDGKHVPINQVFVDMASQPDEVDMTAKKLSDVDESLWSGPNCSRAFEIPPSGANQIMGWDFASSPDQTAYWLADGDPVKTTWEKFFEKHKALFQKRDKRLSDKNHAMQAADLTTTGHEVHYRACVGCGKDFKFTDSWICPKCEKEDAERRRRYSHENKLFRANGIYK